MIPTSTKKRPLKFASTLFILLLFIATSCGETAPSTSKNRLGETNTLDQVKAGVSAVWGTLGQTFKFIGNKNQTLESDQGSRVHVPENAFVVKSTGEPVEGEVELEFIEYHTKGEIIASEIPMIYTNENGEEEQFESAGMFELKATQGNEELALAEGKELKVEMATDVDGNFNFYKLDDQRENWSILEKNNLPVRNTYKEEQEEELRIEEENQPERPRKPVKYKKGDRLFDIKLYRYYEVDLARLNGILWKFTGDEEEKDPTLRKDFKENYRLVYLEPTENNILEYNLHFEGKKDTLDIKAMPVFQGKLLDKENAHVAKMLGELQSSLKRQKKIRDQLKREKDLLRVFNVGDLGVYNCDIQYTDPRAIPFLASFKLEGGGKFDEFCHVYLLPTEKRVVMKFEHTNYPSFRINPNDHNRIVGVTSDNTIYYISDKEINKMRLSKREKGSKVEFHLKKFEQKIKDVGQLDDLIAGI